MDPVVSGLFRQLLLANASEQSTGGRLFSPSIPSVSTPSGQGSGSATSIGPQQWLEVFKILLSDAFQGTSSDPQKSTPSPLLQTQRNADLRGDGDGAMGRGEMLNYRNFLDTEVFSLSQYAKAKAQHGEGYTQEQYKADMKAEHQAINTLIENAWPIHRLDGQSATISANDISQGQAQGLITQQYPGQDTNALVATLKRAMEKGYGNTPVEGLGRGKMLEYRNFLDGEVARLDAAQNPDKAKIEETKAEHSRINYIIANAAEMSALDGQGANISEADVRKFQDNQKAADAPKKDAPKNDVAKAVPEDTPEPAAEAEEPKTA